ncbi:MAG: hypothetical protein EXR31_05715 [Betaproteobacteria bacterium]|nr:hypothetical protein [Betaproteobacteria bacterium]
MKHRTLLAPISLCTLFSLCGCYSPTAQDHAKAKAIASHISNKYGRFEKRNDVEKSHSGKTFFFRPGRYPEVQFYEVIDPKEIAEIEASAREALTTAGADRVDLIFFEKQNLACSPGGVCSRGNENVIKKVLVSK